jgi:hypothetical protein
LEWPSHQEKGCCCKLKEDEANELKRLKYIQFLVVYPFLAPCPREILPSINNWEALKYLFNSRVGFIRIILIMLSN